ncbi:efflux RND transporter periplasmic adaptor subunit [Rhodopseudomonas palustris]|uniref:Efflux RND transporter periplasmic adaptor subunit n=1 Tax=Rhodopseudomonas palustris TaxID=1076 RepID=A0A323ULL8_RHOPL|nr:efflux RND transporter periplasmic adaptor subunit [Rhodopseudomonas palustris]PZA14022.1 efflux RND transporter periplasmic adaptor subunit [Rhodopseudomonas palustris]
MSKPGASRRAVVVGCLLLAAGASYWGWQRMSGERSAGQHAAAQAPSSGGAAQSASGGSSAPIPVTVATAEKADFPVYLSGLGTVQGFNTVVVRSRVDGQIDQIAFKEGQMVQAGDLLAQIDPRPFQATLDQAKAKKAQDEANLANAKLDLSRSVRLGEFATKQQTDTQRSTVQQLTAQIEADEAAIANAQTQLDYATIRAPISGVTGLRQVDKGNIVNAATQTGIVTIAQIEPIAVIFTAPEERVFDINRAQAAHPLQVIALSTDGKTTFAEDGNLAVVNNQVDSNSGTVRLKAVFTNKNHALWPGLAVQTRLLVKTLKDVVVVPNDAIQHGTDGLYAYAVDADNKAELRKIVVGAANDHSTVIERGLEPGDRVVVGGQYKVKPGSLLAFKVADNEPAPSAAPTRK